MARRFITASSTQLSFAAGPLESKAPTAITFAMMIKITVDAFTVYGGIRTSGGTTRMRVDGNNGNYRMYNGAATSTVGLAEPDATDGWALLVAGKGAGTVATAWWAYVLATGGWTTAAGGTLANGSAAGAGGFYHVGLAAESPQADYAAFAIWPRLLTAGEVKRLPSGLWSMTNPDFLVEFPSGGDNPAHTKDLSLNGLRQSSVTLTTRSPLTDPPGFRFSPQNRRR